MSVSAQQNRGSICRGQLEAMIRQHNPKFNIYKAFAYDCNCNLLPVGGSGDRPLIQPGYGQAVDLVDTICKQFKDNTEQYANNGNLNGEY